MRPAICALLLILVHSSAYAQRDPLIGPDRFPEYRNLSGLSGGGYGLDSQGYASLTGPFALSTPIAHVLGHTQWRLNAALASFNSSPQFDNANTNGTLTLALGITVGRFNLYDCSMLLSSTGEYANNIQIGLIPRPTERIALSAGIQGLWGANKSSGGGDVNSKQDSRSFFGVATYRIDTSRTPVYLSAGIGTRRFKKAFASVSNQVWKPIRLYAEYDGFGVNEGVLYTYKPRDEKRGFEFNLSLGYLNARYFVFSSGIGF